MSTRSSIEPTQTSLSTTFTTRVEVGPMPALTLTQPWASLVAIGAKQMETRSWTTRYRGPLAIHAAKTFPGWARELCAQEPFRSALAAGGIHSLADLPRGMVVATCRLVGVAATIPGFPPPGDPEAAFGDYTPGRYAWLLANVCPLLPPQPAKGALGLWTWQPTHQGGQP